MICQETTQFFSDYYDGGLQSGERQSLEEHLRSCQTCTTEYRHFTQSLEALHETRPMETTAAFMATLKASASQQIDRRQNYPKSKSEAMTMVTPKADSRPVGKADSRPVTKSVAKLPATWWVPWALAATTLVAFGLGFAVSGRGKDPEQDQELVAALTELRDLKKRPSVAAAPVNERKILESNGLVEVDGQWIPRKWNDGFSKNMVALAGQMMTREQAAKVLAKEFPVTLFAFDCLLRSDQDLTARPYADRRKALEAVVKPNDGIRHSTVRVTEDVKQAEKTVRKFSKKDKPQ